MKTYKTIHEAYLGTLADVYDNPDHVAEPRGQRTREKLNYVFTITEPKVEPIVTLDEDRNKVIAAYTAKETELYDSCKNDVESFAEASSFWRKLANPDGTVNSAYGYLIWGKKSHGNPNFEMHKELTEAAGQYPVDTSKSMRTPWDWCKQSLLADIDTRQAILRFSLPEHQWIGNRDQTCTLNGIFMIRDNKLNLTVTMRSNDLTLGLVYDLPWFVSLISKMCVELNKEFEARRTSIIPAVQIQPGIYTHIVHSLHIYDRDELKILKMLGRHRDEETA